MLSKIPNKAIFKTVLGSFHLQLQMYVKVPVSLICYHYKLKRNERLKYLIPVKNSR